jgi:hypothetical protein
MRLGPLHTATTVVPVYDPWVVVVMMMMMMMMMISVEQLLD